MHGQVGQAIAVGSLLPEALYLAKMQIDITLAVSLVYKKSISKDDTKYTVLTCFALAMGADFIKRELNIAAIRLTEKAVEGTIARIGEQQIVRMLEKLGIQATKKGILKKVPVVSVVTNAALNYGQIKSFGWVVKKFLSPTFMMCGNCGEEVGKLSKFCPKCGTSFVK